MVMLRRGCDTQAMMIEKRMGTALLKGLPTQIERTEKLLLFGQPSRLFKSSINLPLLPWNSCLSCAHASRGFKEAAFGFTAGKC